MGQLNVLLLLKNSSKVEYELDAEVNGFIETLDALLSYVRE